MTAPTANDQPVTVGTFLVQREEARNGLPVRYTLHVVIRARTLKKGGVSALLLTGYPTFSMETRVTFPRGVITDPFRVWRPAQGDLQKIYMGVV